MAMSRRKIREHIFKLLFNLDFYTGEEDDLQVDLYFREMTPQEQEEKGLLSETWYALRFLADEDADIPEYAADEERAYIADKVEGICRKLPEIDEEIGKVSKGWKVSRMPKTDLAILRLAVYEIRFDEEVPEKVAVNEAVELAKRYGSDDSPSFINGVLSRFVS